MTNPSSKPHSQNESPISSNALDTNTRIHEHDSENSSDSKNEQEELSDDDENDTSSTTKRKKMFLENFKTPLLESPDVDNNSNHPNSIFQSAENVRACDGYSQQITPNSLGDAVNVVNDVDNIFADLIDSTSPFSDLPSSEQIAGSLTDQSQFHITDINGDRQTSLLSQDNLHQTKTVQSVGESEIDTQNDSREAGCESALLLDTIGNHNVSCLLHAQVGYLDRIDEKKRKMKKLTALRKDKEMKKESIDQDSVKKPIKTDSCGGRFLYIIVAVSAVTGFLMGYDLCIVAVVLSPIRNQFDICNHNEASAGALTAGAPCFTSELFVAVLAPGAMLGSIAGGFAADSLGRKRLLLISDAFFAVAAMLMAFTRSYLFMLLGRVLLGVGVGMGFVVFPAYVSEVAPKHLRGSLVTCQEVAQCLGCLVAYAVAALFPPDVFWRLLVGFAAVPAVVQLVGTLILPESPRWLVKRRNVPGALAALSRIGGRYLRPEIHGLKTSQKKSCRSLNDVKINEKESFSSRSQDGDTEFTLSGDRLKTIVTVLETSMKLTPLIASAELLEEKNSQTYQTEDKDKVSVKNENDKFEKIADGNNIDEANLTDNLVDRKNEIFHLILNERRIFKRKGLSSGWLKSVFMILKYYQFSETFENNSEERIRNPDFELENDFLQNNKNEEIQSEYISVSSSSFRELSRSICSGSSSFFQNNNFLNDPELYDDILSELLELLEQWMNSEISKHKRYLADHDSSLTQTKAFDKDKDKVCDNDKDKDKNLTFSSRIKTKVLLVFKNVFSRFCSRQPNDVTSRIKSLLQKFSSRRNQLLLAAGCAVAQNFTGANTILYYSVDVMAIGGICNPVLTGTMIGVMKLTGVILLVLVLEKVGRRTPLMIGTIGTFCGLTGMAIVLWHTDASQSCLSAPASAPASASASIPTAPASIAVMLLIWLLMFCWNISWAGLMFVVASEVLPSDIRGIGLGTTIFAFWFFAFIFQLTFRLVVQKITASGAFSVLAGLTLLVLFFVIFAVPDHSGKSLESIQKSQEESKNNKSIEKNKNKKIQENNQINQKMLQA